MTKSGGETHAKSLVLEMLREVRGPVIDINKIMGEWVKRGGYG